ncbi:hypothetical protein [Pseudomonas sp. 'CRE Jenny 4']|uniref:hypothetical protein n=1 Tax=Pseudomonas sp. 'CRE Jenny 4' TaxID=3045817 RepID=UPI0025A2BB0F|nr:hypothetical protein [Pseudomonas sp. 'CRE Jenny 4']
MRYNTGNPVGPDGSSAPEDLYDNSGIIDLVVTGQENTTEDRLGRVILTLKGMSSAAGDATIAIGAAQEALASSQKSKVSADQSAASAAEAAASAAIVDATNIQGYVAEAEAAADRAEQAAATAGIFTTVAAGLAATTTGKYFSVPSADDGEYTILYLNESGVAQEVKRYPSKKAVDRVRLSSGEKLLSVEYSTLAEAISGATFLKRGGKVVGLNFPIGSSGANSYVIHWIELDAATQQALAGSTIRLKLVADCSVNFSAKVTTDFVGFVWRNGAGVQVGTLASQSIVNSRFVREVTYTVTAQDEKIGLVVQIAGGSTTGHFYNAASLSYSIDNWIDGTTSAADFLVEQGIEPQKQQLLVRPDGTGDYLTPLAATSVITSAGRIKEYDILVGPGTYTDRNWYVKNRTNLIGQQRIASIIASELPDNVNPVTIQDVQTLWVNGTTRLSNLSVTGRNVRYPIHSEGAGANKNTEMVIENCHIEHLGNDGARQYQIDNGGNPDLVWPFTTAWGWGAASGQRFTAIRSTFRSPTVAWYIHTNSYFDKACVSVLENCECIATNADGKSIRLQPLGSLQSDLVQVNNCLLVGDIDYIPSPWIPTALADQPADHSEISLIGSGNSPAVFTVSDFGRAFRIDSALVGPGSAIAANGSAADALFGNQNYAKNGVTGFAGYRYGWADISGVGVGQLGNVFVTSMGKRLGDCTGTPKTLSVFVNFSATPVNIVFNQNYTNATNASILSTINTALAGSAVASEYAVGEKYRPHFTDEEMLLKNLSSEGIPMGAALAFSGSNKQVRKMTSTDSPAIFAGIAWEDIYPGQFGRVKTKGYLSVKDVLGTLSGLSYGQALYVDPASPGRVVTATGANPIMTAIRADAVQVSPK